MFNLWLGGVAVPASGMSVRSLYSGLSDHVFASSSPRGIDEVSRGLMPSASALDAPAPGLCAFGASGRYSSGCVSG